MAELGRDSVAFLPSIRGIHVPSKHFHKLLAFSKQAEGSVWKYREERWTHRSVEVNGESGQAFNKDAMLVKTDSQLKRPPSGHVHKRYLDWIR